MPNQGMLRGSGVRGGGLREQRQKVDTGRGEPRVAQGRAEHQGRGAFVNFYEDLGISTVEPAAQQMRAEEKDFQAKVSTRKAEIEGYRNQYQGALSQVQGSRSQWDTANNQLSEAAKNLPGLSDAVNQSWDQYRSTMAPVRVVSGNNVEQTYYLPKDVINSLNSEAFNRGDGSYTGNWVDNGAYYNVDVRVKGQGGSRGQELHELLSNTYGQVESQYKSRAAEQLAAQLSAANSSISNQASVLGAAGIQLAANESAVGLYGASLSAAEGELQGTIAARQAQWDKLHERYNQRAEQMDSILSSIDVGGYNG